MLKRGIVLISLLLMPGTIPAGHASQEKRLVDEIGQMLATWSTDHQTTIRINGQPISLSGGPLYIMQIEQTPDGPRRVCRGRIIFLWPPDQETDEKSRTIRDNLQSLIEKGHCDLQMLSTYVEKMK